MRKILFVGDFATPTGFAQVVENIIKRFNKTGEEMEMVVLATNYHGKIPIIPMPNLKIYIAKSYYGLEEIRHIMVEERPNILFTINDTYTIPMYYKRIADVVKNTIWITYAYFDGAPLNEEWASYLKFVNMAICPTNWQNRMIVDNEYLPQKSVVTICNGFDSSVYYPLNKEERTKIRKELFPDIKGVEDTFIVGMVAKNFFRKRWPEIFMAFADFNKFVCEKSMLLCYSTNGFDLAGYDFEDLTKTFGLSGKVSIIADENPLSDKKMNELYNIMDVNALISVGEGFGLPTLYASAAGVRTVVSDNSVNPSLMGYIPGMVIAKSKPDPIIFAKDNNCIRYMPNPIEICKQIKAVYENKTGCSNEEARSLISKATADNGFEWEFIVPQIKSLTKELLYLNSSEGIAEV